MFVAGEDRREPVQDVAVSPQRCVVQSHGFAGDAPQVVSCRPGLRGLGVALVRRLHPTPGPAAHHRAPSRREIQAPRVDDVLIPAACRPLSTGADVRAELAAAPGDQTPGQRANSVTAVILTSRKECGQRPPRSTRTIAESERASAVLFASTRTDRKNPAGRFSRKVTPDWWILTSTTQMIPCKERSP